MPDMDGCEVARRIRAGRGRNAATPTIAVNDADSEADQARSRAAGMNAVVGKPLEARVLLAVLARVLDAAAVAAPPVARAGLDAA